MELIQSQGIYGTVILYCIYHQDPFIRVEITDHNSTQCISWGYGKLRTIQISKHLDPYLDLLNLSICYLQFDYI